MFVHLFFSVSISSKDFKCESCNFNDQCQYNQVSMATTAEFYILECLGPGIPIYSLLNKDGVEGMSVGSVFLFILLVDWDSMECRSYKSVFIFYTWSKLSFIKSSLSMYVCFLTICFFCFNLLVSRFQFLLMNYTTFFCITLYSSFFFTTFLCITLHSFVTLHL